MKRITIRKLLKRCLILLLGVISLSGSAQEEYCCWRTIMFPPFKMPKEQEHDFSGFIAGDWNSHIHDLGAAYLGECPLTIEILSHSGVRDLNEMVEGITAVTTGKPKRNPSEYQDPKMNVDYIWKGILELTYIEKIVPGSIEPAYEGGTEYIPGYVEGGWKFTIQLYDVQHDEIVKEAHTTWTGTPLGFQKNLKNEYFAGKTDKIRIEILKELFNREFKDLKKIIIDYEKAPKKAEFESEVIKVESDKTKRITFKVTDEKGEKPKKWQRLAVKVDHGSLTNGTRCCDFSEGPKFYSFLCENGNVTIEYKAPPEEGSRLDHITVFNGCVTRDPPVIRMEMVDEREEIGSVDIDINPVYETRLIVKGSFINNASYRRNFKDEKGTERYREDLNEVQEATFYVPLELERSDDMPILNQVWEYYRPKSITLTNCNIYSRKYTSSYASSPAGGHDLKSITIKEPLYLEIFGKEAALQSNILVIIDKETGKVVKASPGGFAVDFFWHERYQQKGKVWSKEEGEKPVNVSENKTDEYRSEYSPGPVEDPVPDPTFRSISQSLRTFLNNMGTPLPANIEIPEDEEHPEIEPELLVKFGDGKKFFGGKGKVVLENEYGPDSRRYSEKTFYWQITRTRK